MIAPLIPDESDAPEASDEPEDLRAFYDARASDYEGDAGDPTYAEARRCAEALARFATDQRAPLAEFGCGAGLGGLALRAAGFDCIDGFDGSEEMLERSAEKGIYRSLSTLDLSGPLGVEPGLYANAAAIESIDPASMPATVVDAMVRMLPSGGCLALSLGAGAAADGSIRGRIFELTDTGWADLMLAEEAGSNDAGATIYVLRRR
ncbi:hypothetical protein H0I76_02010 [Limibaculum sp. M0105]|uniref:Methyltransferase domain-containing protein n=1 Tax=Thermohalobaculum xanthum TaxID=2753746 RepID=A0A8J7SC07_9RHOB|nr:hypothetical protein [Thermohalobaculum xanthum]MBK0397951.1 hypothetical protein [Thermohalobaculum xanthum]